MANKTQFAVVVLHTDQYAAGITGQDCNAYIYNNNGQFFNTRKECQETLKVCKAKYKTKIFDKVDGLGHYYTIQIMESHAIEQIHYRYTQIIIEN